MTHHPEKIRWLRKGEKPRSGDYIRWSDGIVTRTEAVYLFPKSGGPEEGIGGITCGYFRFERVISRKARREVINNHK